jgi:hypothetical protein
MGRWQTCCVYTQKGEREKEGNGHGSAPALCSKWCKSRGAVIL